MTSARLHPSRLAMVSLAMALVSAAVPPSAGAVTLPGTNGLIAAEGPLGADVVIAIDPAAGTRTTLTGSVAADEEPEASPNGAKVAFRNGMDIWTSDFPSGANRTQVTSGGPAAGFFAFPSWSPDGTTIVFACTTGLCTVPATGGPVTHVTGTSTEPMDFRPAYSPDGRYIVFGVLGEGGLFRVNADGTGARTAILGSLTGDASPEVSPDGRTLYFDDFFGAGTGIFSVPFPDGGARTMLAGTGPFDSGPFPSPDGTKVAFTGGTAAAGGASAPLSFVKADGSGGRTTIGGSLAGDDFASWARGAGAVPPVSSNRPPVFTSSSPCGSVVLTPALGVPATVAVSAADPDAGQSVSLAASSLPAWASFASSAGNPATGTITARPTIFDWLLSLFSGVSRVTLTATDSGTPPRSAACEVALRVALFTAPS